MYYDYRQDEDYLVSMAEDAQFAFINGQNDALELLAPQDPSDPAYMDGWQDTKRNLAQGEPEICRIYEQKLMTAHCPRHCSLFPDEGEF